MAFLRGSPSLVEGEVGVRVYVSGATAQCEGAQQSPLMFWDVKLIRAMPRSSPRKEATPAPSPHQAGEPSWQSPHQTFEAQSLEFLPQRSQ